ncbi:MAG: DUF3857 domain-containing protein [Cyclobacteriaceae bacterium]
MKKILILVLLLSQSAYSQTLEIEFGKITIDELKMKSYEEDKEAKAVILYDKGKSIFFQTENDFNIRFKRHKRIKVFDKTQSQYAEVFIPFYDDGYGTTEIVKSIQARTYNIVDGIFTTKELDPSTVYDEQINARWHMKKFVFPDVQDGAILEYSYVLESPFLFNLPDWTFQDKIPTVYSEYQVNMIPFYEYVSINQGISRFDYQNTEVAEESRTWGSIRSGGIGFKDYVSTYVMKDVPAFRDESYILSFDDYIMKMDFLLAKYHSSTGRTTEIISTWPELNESLLKHDYFGEYLNKSSKFAKKVLAENLTIENQDENEKAKQIVEYVKNNFEWNGYSGKYATQSAKEFFNNKRGNDADINLFLISLLNEAGINAEPLILSTRTHGKILIDYPFNRFTDYVIAFVNTDIPFMADGTEDILLT